MAKNSVSAATIFSSVRWTSVGFVVGYSIRTASILVLARLLDPEDFGLLGMAVVVTSFLRLLQFMGTSQIVIQKENVSSKLTNSLFIVNVAFGFLCTIVLVLFGPFIAKIYENSQASLIIQALSLTFAVSSFGIIPRALLNRKMMFNRVTQIELASGTVRATVAILLAYMTWKVWALVVANIIEAALLAYLLYWASGWHLKWRFYWSEFKDVMKFSLHLTASNIAVYSTQNVDKLIIGRYFGAVGLGYYSMAYNLYLLPFNALKTVLKRVLFSAFSRMQDDDVRIGESFLRAVRCIWILIFPIMMGLFVLASPFVSGVLGEKWNTIIPVLKVFSLMGILQTITLMSGSIWLAKGRTGLILSWQLCSGIVIVLSFFCGLPWGIIGISTAYLIAMIPLSFFRLVITLRLISVSLRTFLKNLVPYTGASLAMAGAVFICKAGLVNASFTPIIVLLICVTLGVAMYTAIILLFRPAAFPDIVRFVVWKFPRLESWALSLGKS